jgi:hypothetical protein
MTDFDLTGTQPGSVIPEQPLLLGTVLPRPGVVDFYGVMIPPATAAVVVSGREVFQRAYDLGGTDDYVYWTSSVPDPTPGVTTPVYTGTLVAYEIVLDNQNC